MSDRDCENCKHHTEKGCDSWDCNFEQGMTREDAIKRLKLWLICSEEYTEDDVSMNEAIRIAINSLEIDERYELEYEQIEPCEDAISRQAVLDIVNNPLNIRLDAIIKDLPPVTPQPKWISVNERMPEEDKTVIASTEYGVYPEAKYSKEYGWEWAYESGADYWRELEGVTAWMPLPKPYNPQEESEETE